MSKICTLVFMTLVSLMSAAAESAEEDPFTFDYKRLRVGGLILAAVLCLIGITILLSGHCRCKFNQNKRRRTQSNTQQMLTDKGAVHSL
uniref:FXYD domain-containing ion transport regulator n=1 Tax=Kryptolebias marmoratus TaxID=37003 RepID=A0A3Q3BH29_KRYMA